jgi:hypothetical protein
VTRNETLGMRHSAGARAATAPVSSQAKDRREENGTAVGGEGKSYRGARDPVL